MHRRIYLPVILLLTACDSESGREQQARDISEAISFTELVDKRMAVDTNIDGETILITSEVNAYFNQNEGCAVNPEPAPICDDYTYSTEVSEPSYQNGAGIGACSGYGFELINSDFSEKLNVNLDDDSKFFSLNEEYNVPVNFYAKVEFIERKVWCSEQINFGIKLTLKEGEESYLLEQFKRL